MSDETRSGVLDSLREGFDKYFLSVIKKGMFTVMSKEIEMQEYIDEAGEFWTKAVKETLRESLAVIESSARQIITVNGIVIALYFHAVTYSKAVTQLSTFAALIYLAPVVCWLVSLVFSLLIIGPELRPMRLLNEETARQDFITTSRDKFQKYRQSIISFIAGVAFLLLVLFHYLVIFPHKG